MVRTATLTALGLVLALGGTAAAQQAGGGATGGGTGRASPAAGGGIGAGTSTATGAGVGAGIGTGTGAGIGTGTGAGIGTGTGAGLTGTGAGAGMTATGSLTGAGTAMPNPLPDVSIPNGNPITAPLGAVRDGDSIAVPTGPEPDGRPPESRVVVPDTTNDTATGQRVQKLPGEPLQAQPGAQAAVPINPLTTGVGGDVEPKTVRVGSGTRRTNGGGAPVGGAVTRSATGAVTGTGTGGAGGTDESGNPNVIAVPYQK